MTDTESMWASPGSPHCPTGQMHLRTPRSLPQSALSWMHPQQRLCSHPAPRPQLRAGGTPTPSHGGVRLGQTHRETHQTWVSAKQSHHQSSPPPLPPPPPPLLGTVLALVPCWDGEQWAAAWGGPTTRAVPDPVCRLVCTLMGITLRLWGCCCSFTLWLPGNDEPERWSRGAVGLNANEGHKSFPSSPLASPHWPKPLGGPTLALKSKWEEEGPGF